MSQQHDDDNALTESNFAEWQRINETLFGPMSYPAEAPLLPESMDIPATTANDSDEEF